LASSEAQDVLHQAMRPASYHLIRMATKIASDLRVFFCNNQFLFVAQNQSLM
jgi:hypothetical protein